MFEEEQAEELPPPCIDLTEFKIKIDHFDQIHVLGQENKIDGAENFRQVRKGDRKTDI